MKRLLMLGLIIIGLFQFVYADSEIIYPRVEIVNKTTSNSVVVTEILPDIPKQKLSEITLKSDEFTIFKQRQAGDYVLLTVVNFDGKSFIYNYYKMMLTFHSKSSAEFAFYDLNNKLVLAKIAVAKDKEEKVDISLNGKDDIVLGYLGYDVNELPAYKVKAYLPQNTLYHKGHYCKLADSLDKYECFKEDAGTGKVSETYFIDSNELALSGQTIEEKVQENVKEDAIAEKDTKASEDAKKQITEVGTKESSFNWYKIGGVLVIILLVILLIIKSRKVKNKEETDFNEEGKY